MLDDSARVGAARLTHITHRYQQLQLANYSSLCLQGTSPLQKVTPIKRKLLWFLCC